MRFIKKCLSCDLYTLREHCPCCSNKTIDLNIPNIGLEDPYQKYRVIRKLKEEGKWDLIKLLS